MNRRDYLFSALGAATTVAASGALAGPAWGRTVEKSAARRLQDSTLLVDGLDPSGLTEKYFGMLETAGVDCWHQSMGGFDSFVNLLHFCDTYSNRIVQVGTVREIRAAQKAGKVGHLSGWQSAETLIRDGDTTMPAIRNLRAYRELGLRICGLVYNTASSFGGGALDPGVGLTRAGKRLVEEVHKQRIVLDVGGHSGEQTSFDAIEISQGVPIICSHTNLRALVDNPRNMTDRLIEKIAATGGVIGLTTVNDVHAPCRRRSYRPRTRLHVRSARSGRNHSRTLAAGRLQQQSAMVHGEGFRDDQRTAQCHAGADAARLDRCGDPQGARRELAACLREGLGRLSARIRDDPRAIQSSMPTQHENSKGRE
jgi:membrane dipeptidase